MTDHVHSGPSFSRLGVLAAPDLAAQTRHELSAWLRSALLLDEVKFSDVLLAVNEALANAAEFAYASACRPGLMHVRAEYDPELATLTVTVADEGAWRVNDAVAEPDPARGRGLTLMHALTDRAVIDGTPTGTRVLLQWDHIRARPGGSGIESAIRPVGAGPPEQRTHRSAGRHS